MVAGGLVWAAIAGIAVVAVAAIPCFLWLGELFPTTRSFGISFGRGCKITRRRAACDNMSRDEQLQRDAWIIHPTLESA